MKRTVIYTLFILMNVINMMAQTIEDLESRYQPPVKISNSYHNRFGWDDFVDALTPDERTWGVGYGYSTKFPVEISANLTFSCFSVGAELGFSCDKKEYKLEKYNPSLHFAVSPGFYFRYISLNLGLGAVMSDYFQTTEYGPGDVTKEEFSVENTDVTISGSTTITASASVSYSKNKFHFMLKPSITGYIPICYEDYYITLNVGYNYFPAFKELNCWYFGVGFQWNLF